MLSGAVVSDVFFCHFYIINYTIFLSDATGSYYKQFVPFSLAFIIVNLKNSDILET